MLLNLKNKNTLKKPVAKILLKVFIFFINTQ